MAILLFSYCFLSLGRQFNNTMQSFINKMLGRARDSHANGAWLMSDVQLAACIEFIMWLDCSRFWVFSSYELVMQKWANFEVEIVWSAKV